MVERANCPPESKATQRQLSVKRARMLGKTGWISFNRPNTGENHW